MTHEMPVLVIGGGPAGLAAAIELGTRGVECQLIEPRAAVSHTRPRGKTTHARTMEHFRRWGIADELRAITTTPTETFHDVAFCTTLLGHEVHRMPNALGLYPSRRPEMSETGLFIGQPLVEEALRRKAATLAPVRARYGHRATGRVTERPEYVDVEIADGDGGVETMRARYVLVADGPRSILRDALGISLIGGTAGGRSVSALFRARGLWNRVWHAPAVFYWCLSQQRAGNLSPYDVGRDIWVASWQATEHDVEPVAAIEAMVGEPTTIDVLNVDVWQSRSVVARHYRRGRLFLLGDAARQTPPWGGHGYNTGVQDAVDLAWKVAAVVGGWADDALLDTYEAERRPVAEQVIATSTQNLSVLSSDLVKAGIEGDGQRGERARAMLAEEIDVLKRPEFYSLGLVLGYTYAASPAVLRGARDLPNPQPSPVSTYEPTFAGGARLPHTWLPDGRSLYDRLGPDFTVLVTEAADAHALVREAGPIPLTVLTSEELPDSYVRPQVVVVRPDQHVTWSGVSLDVDAEQIWSAAVHRDLHTTGR